MFKCKQVIPNICWLSVVILLFCFVNPDSLRAQSPKVVFIEEAVGTWCGWCPQGQTQARQLLADYPDQILISAIHVNDPMARTPAYYDSTNLIGFPASHMDRNLLNIDPDEWQDHIEELLNQEVHATLSFSGGYNADNTKILAEICVEISDPNLVPDLSLAALIVGDNVSGEPSDYSQNNFYSGGAQGEQGDFASRPFEVNAEFMVYDHAVKTLLTDYHGDDTIIPENPVANQAYCLSINQDVDWPVDRDQQRIYGLLINQEDGTIYQAGAGTYLAGNSFGFPRFHGPTLEHVNKGANLAMDVLFHDVDTPDDELEFSIAEKPDWISLENDGPFGYRLLGSTDVPGNYQVMFNLKDETNSLQFPYTIIVDEEENPWDVIGGANFSVQETENLVTSASNTDGSRIAVMGIDRDDQVFVYEYHNDTWTDLAIDNDGFSDFGAICYGPNDQDIYVFHRVANDSRVFHFNGESWNQLGDALALTSYHNIAFTDGVLHISGYRSGTGIGFFAWENDAWQPLDSPVSDQNLLRPQMVRSLDDQLYMLVAEFFNGQSFSRVFHYQNQEWLPVGTLINPEKPTSENYRSYHKISVADNGQLYAILGHTNAAALYQFNGDEWIEWFDNLDQGSSDAFDILALGEDRVLIAYTNEYRKLVSFIFDGDEINIKELGVEGITKNLIDLDLVGLSNQEVGLLYGDNYESLGRLNAIRVDLSTLSQTNTTFIEAEYKLAYPNPTQGLIYWEPEAIGHPFTIWTLDGKRMIDGICNQALDISKLPKGVFIIRLDNGRSQKIINQ